MENIRVIPTEKFFSFFFGPLYSILYAQSEALKNVNFFVTKLKGSYLVKKTELTKRFLSVEDLLSEHKELLKNEPEEINLEKDCVEEVLEMID